MQCRGKYSTNYIKAANLVRIVQNIYTINLKVVKYLVQRSYQVHDHNILKIPFKIILTTLLTKSSKLFNLSSRDSPQDSSFWRISFTFSNHMLNTSFTRWPSHLHLPNNNFTKLWVTNYINRDYLSRFWKENVDLWNLLAWTMRSYKFQIFFSQMWGRCKFGIFCRSEFGIFCPLSLQTSKIVLFCYF